MGVTAVIAESFERIHRSNLVGMGVIPFEFTNGDTRKSLGLTGDEIVSIQGLEGDLKPLSTVDCIITYKDGAVKVIALRCRIDTEIEIEYVEILNNELKELIPGVVGRILIAAKLGNTRLIDNMPLGEVNSSE